MTLSREDKDNYNAILYCLFNEWIDEIEEASETEKQEVQEVMKHFAKIEGVKRESPLAMMFIGFGAGVTKGIELVTRIERISTKES